MWSDWLVFCDCGFQTVCPLIVKDRRLVEDSWWERLTEGETGSCFLGGAMLSKSLIQFSVDEWGCFPPLLFTWANCGGGNEENGVFIQKVPCRHCYTSAPSSAACLHPPMSPPETPGHSGASLGQYPVGSLLLSSGSWRTQGSVCALQESISQFCVSSGSSMVGLMATSSKRAYAMQDKTSIKSAVTIDLSRS